MKEDVVSSKWLKIKSRLSSSRIIIEGFLYYLINKGSLICRAPPCNNIKSLLLVLKFY